MKKNMPTTQPTYPTCLLLLLLLFTACKKEINTTTNDTSAAQITFTIKGVKSDDSKIASTNPTIVGNKVSENPSIEHKILDANNDIEMSSITELMESSFDDPNAVENWNTKIHNKLAANIGMTTGHKYRVVLLNESGQVINTVQAVAGSPITIDLVKGQKYNWYAYSYDDTEDIPVPTAAQTLETPTNKSLMYAKGSEIFTAVAGNNPIAILFEHKLALVSIELDYDRLFAKIPTNNPSNPLEQSITNNFSWRFTSNPDFLYKGTFSLTTGTITNPQPYSVNLNDIIQDHPTIKKIKIARCYIVQPANNNSTNKTFGVEIEKLNIVYPNTPTGTVVELVPATTVSRIFGPVPTEPGKKLIAKFKLWYKFKERKILHVTRIGADNYGYAAQPWSSNGTSFPGGTNNRASYNMISEQKNYGLLSTSIVRSGGFSHQRCYLNGTLNTFLDAASKPDIVIISVYYRMNNDDITSLKTYIDNGGVVLLMTDGIDANDRIAQQPFFNLLFGNPTPAITLQNNGYSSGALYQMGNIDDEILNGPFGDIRQKYWGEDASATTSLTNVPESMITTYSDSKAANGTVAPNGITMFKHNTRHFFWIGDGGFLSNQLTAGIYNNYLIEPFATVNTASGSNNTNPALNYTNYPIPKLYGYAGNGIVANTTLVWNSVVFANIMSWAVINAEFFGINTGGLGSGDYTDF